MARVKEWLSDWWPMLAVAVALAIILPFAIWQELKHPCLRYRTEWHYRYSHETGITRYEPVQVCVERKQ